MTKSSGKLAIFFNRLRNNRFAVVLGNTLLVAILSVGFALLLQLRDLPFQFLPTVSVILMVAAALILTRFHLRRIVLGTIDSVVAERIVWTTALLSILGVQLLNRSLGHHDLLGMGFLMITPIVAQSMLVSALGGSSLSLFATTGVMLLLGASGALPVAMLAAAWLAGAVGAHAVNPLKHRSDLIRATTIQSLAMAIIGASIATMNADNVGIVIESAGWAALAGVGATSIFWLAVTLFERGFGIISNWSLLELCSPEHPLIRDLTLRAPGTYAHSVLVGNLAENAARAIGANPVLVRAMSYFHDIGKLDRPIYFIENQMGDNPHDTMNPELSAKVLADHVRHGLELAQKHALPRVIQDGIATHHGNSLMTYFYQRAKTQTRDNELGPVEADFRYLGPKPTSKECAILMLADSVEAASRTLGRSSSEQVEILVSKIIEDKRSDGQLDESELTFKDLQQIQISFLRSLCALRHDRVPYSEKQDIENDIAYPSNHHLSELPEPSSRQQYSDGA